MRRTFPEASSGWFVDPRGNWIAGNGAKQSNEKKMKPTKTNPLLTRNCIKSSALRRGFCLITLTWFALSPTLRAVDPPPDGGYPGNNTAEGDNALLKLTSG